jgi:Putative transposase/Transposase zinc-binding domain
MGVTWRKDAGNHQMLRGSYPNPEPSHWAYLEHSYGVARCNAAYRRGTLLCPGARLRPAGRPWGRGEGAVRYPDSVRDPASTWRPGPVPATGSALAWALPRPSPMAPACPERVYCRRKPEHDVLHQVLSQHLNTFVALTEQDGADGLPEFVKKELYGYLDCGLLCRGAVRVFCPTCNRSLVVALSCKGRGVCPSCGGRRMADTATHLVDRVIPDVAVRQYVLSLPHKYRFTIAKDRQLVKAALGIFIGVVFTFLKKAAQALGLSDPRPGSVTAIQNFADGALWNLHFHSLVLQGVYHRPHKDQPPVFVPLPPPAQEDVAHMTLSIKEQVVCLLRRRGLLPKDPDCADPETSLWERLCAAAVDSRIATGPKAGWRIARLHSRPVLLPPGPRHLCADADGFNLHAHTHVGAGHREALERLCKYILRPALCNERLSFSSKGEVIVSLKRTWSDGTRALVFSPLEFVEKVATLVPRPRAHLVIYHGVLSSHSSWRSEIIPRPAATQAEPVPSDEQHRPAGDQDLPPVRPRRLPWADLLRRTWEIDVLQCTFCGGRMKVVAVVTDRAEVARLCQNLGEPAEPPPVAPARLPAQLDMAFAQGP